MSCNTFSRSCVAIAATLAALPAAFAQTVHPLPDVLITAETAGSFSSRNVQVGAFRDLDPLDVPLTNNVVTREALDAQGTRSLFGALVENRGNYCTLRAYR